LVRTGGRIGRRIPCGIVGRRAGCWVGGTAVRITTRKSRCRSADEGRGPCSGAWRRDTCRGTAIGRGGVEIPLGDDRLGLCGRCRQYKTGNGQYGGDSAVESTHDSFCFPENLEESLAEKYPTATILPTEY
jgi:hypothetical protein